MSAESAPTAVSLDTPRILLVDDRPSNLLALAAVLAPLGYELLEAQSGDEALSLLLRHDVALIVLDVQMPSLDGFETAELIRARPRTEHVPLIFLTAIDGEPAHRIRGYETGAVDYICKPFDPAVLRAKVRVLVQLWEQRQLIVSQRAELAGRVEELDRANAALARQTDELERSNEALRGFAEAMANELREPLHTLAGLAELLVEEHGAPLPDDARELATRTAVGARALDAKLTTLLEFAHVSTDSFVLDEVALPELIADVQREVSGGSGMTLDPPTVPRLTVLGDRRQLRELLLAMFEHIARRSGESSPRLRVVRSEDSVVVSLADEAAALDLAEMKQLFGLFPSPERADPSRPSGRLAVARRIAERHGGELWWEAGRRGGALLLRLPLED